MEKQFEIDDKGYYKANNGRKVFIHFFSNILSYGVISGDASHYLYKKDGSLFKYRGASDTVWKDKSGSSSELFNDLSIIDHWEKDEPFKLKLRFS